jgi:hypothetical protein
LKKLNSIILIDQVKKPKIREEQYVDEQTDDEQTNQSVKVCPINKRNFIFNRNISFVGAGTSDIRTTLVPTRRKSDSFS